MSLVSSPLLVGFAMDRYGRWLASRGEVPSYAATFWGGALFAIGMASARFLLVRA